MRRIFGTLVGGLGLVAAMSLPAGAAPAKPATPANQTAKPVSQKAKPAHHKAKATHHKVKAAKHGVVKPGAKQQPGTHK